MGSMKTCGRCDQVKPLECFTRDKGKLSGYRSTCKACTAEMTKERRTERRVPCPGCGDLKGHRARLCKSCQLAEATAVRAAQTALPAQVHALRRAKAQTRRWLREESRKRCPVCLTHVQGKGATYCSYACFSTTQVPSGNRRNISRGIRARVFARDGFVCQICRTPTSEVHTPQDDLSPELDHIICVRDGGKSTLDNLRVVHRVCNRDRNLILWSV